MSRDQIALRLIVFVAPLVAALSAFAAAHHGQWWFLLPVAVLSVSCTVQPDTNLGLLTVVALCWQWVAMVDERRTPWLLVAGLALFSFHAASAAATVAPPAARWTPSMRRLWLHRSAAVLAITCAAWCMRIVLATHRFTGSAVLLFVALVASAAMALLLRARALAVGHDQTSVAWAEPPRS